MDRLDERRAGRWWRSPVVILLAISVPLVAGIFLGTNAIAARAARDAALDQAQSNTRLLAESTIPGNLTIGLLKPRAGAVDKFSRKVSAFNNDQVESFDIFTADGRLAYDSTSPGVALDEHVYDLSPAQRQVLAEGGTAAEFADPRSQRSNDRVGSEAGLVKITTRVQATQNKKGVQEAVRRGDSAETVPALFVAYWDLEGVEERRGEIFGAFRWITLGPLLLLVAISTAMLAFLTGQVRRASLERERLLRVANDASDAERRRIARDLHDGVVQDLAGTQFAIAAVAREGSLTPQSRDVLGAASSSLRDSLKQMRSLLAEIHPPDLHGRGLSAALGDLIAPAAAAGIQASVSVVGVEDAPEDEVAIVWRVAQEAVRNTLRHSEASTLAVTVRGDATGLVLEVVDDGVGFDTEAPSAADRFGLRGMRSLVRDVGGELDVRSSEGDGTTVRMAVRR